MLRCLLASLLLINYLLVVGLGCISRPEDQQEFLLVQTSEAGKQYQECRYMRMDGLENFLLESLASRYQKATDTPKHNLISVIRGIDAHCLMQELPPPTVLLFLSGEAPARDYRLAMIAAADRPINAPPWAV